MKKHSLHPLDAAALQALARKSKPGDWLVLADDVLLAALSGSQALSRVEREGLLNSPLTLRRMMELEARRLAAKTATEKATPVVAAGEAANDPLYTAPFQLLAADSGSEAFCLTSDDGWWRLSFPQTREGWLIEIELREDAPFEHMLDENLPAGQSQRSVAVVDGQKRTLLLGQLNFNRTLSAPWPLHESPRAALAQSGGVEVVVV